MGRGLKKPIWWAFIAFFVMGVLFVGVGMTSMPVFNSESGGVAAASSNTTEEKGMLNANVTQRDNVNMYFIMPETKVGHTVGQQLKGTGLLFLPYAPGSTFPESAAPKGIRDPGTLPEVEGTEKGLSADSGYLGGLR